MADSDPKFEVAQRLRTDSILHYKTGSKLDDFKLAVPNWSDDIQSINSTIVQLIELVGQNTLLIMTGNDARLRTAPYLDTIRTIHSLHVRFLNLLGSRARKENQTRFQGQHNTPSIIVPKVYPVPYGNVENRFLKDFCEISLQLQCEMLQHTENAIPFTISQAFADMAYSYSNRMYSFVAMDLFGISPSVAEAPGFILTEEQLAAYAPSKWIAPTERINTVARLDQILTEDAMRYIRGGIPITELPPNLLPFSGSSLTGDDLSSQRVASQVSSGGGFTPSTPVSPTLVTP